MQELFMPIRLIQNGTVLSKIILLINKLAFVHERGIR